MSVLVIFNEVSPPALPDVREDGIAVSERKADPAPSTLDGTTAPQGGSEVHSVTAPSPDDSAAHLSGLLQETGQGSHAAFTEFYQRTSRRVFGVVRRVVIDSGLSEEVTQEVFVVAWRDSAKYDPAQGSPMAWLLTIAHRKAVDKVRAHQSSTNRDAKWATASWTRPYDEVPTSLLDRMEALQLKDSLATLSPLQREAIVLAYFGALTYREVAEKLSKPLPTIKSRIRDGLNQLREELRTA
ncbi:ECF RNA polymerase sigma factor SigK [Paenarthrobacter ilicis]|uniref:RNA polymerase sigma factor n=1 Tax=Paenarthrobacter ilicis TaxID=43665 RepID=A0ABX0TE55_9MICC|nr:RNA polymerase sigma-70 factor (ECF subfamily) [Paenarthrobacter ilicis]NIJ00808.1 RNA polymerase sigma-70 factor (ECF subfamily) [Paenarthrobacter ilicis]